MPTGSRGEITIKRHKAARFAETGKCDHNGEHTIFGQIYQQCKSKVFSKDCFRMNGTDDQIFRCNFAGEGSIDVGGPFRECLTNLLDEFESNQLPLLIKTPNNRNNHGYNRECFCLNPASITPTHKELFIFLGYFIGFSIRTKSAMNWHFPPIFWKQLLESPVTVNDFEGLDAYSFQIIKDLEKHGAKLTAEEFDMVVEETFQTHLSDGTQVELVPNGAETRVTHANYKEFLEKMLECRLKESARQMEWVREGVSYVIDTQVLSFLSWEDVELRASGSKEIEVEALKKITKSNVGEDHKIIKWFWEIFEEFNQDQRRLYLKFVWGRSKIPSDTSNLRYKHEIEVYDHMNPESLPQAHTCFFTIDLPVYNDKETMKKRILTAIELCGEIDTDNNAEYIPDEDGNRRNNDY